MWKKIGKYKYFIPFFLYFIIFYLWSLYYVIKESLNKETPFFKNYFEVMKEGYFFKELIYTLRINIVSSIIVLLIAIFILYLIYCSEKLGKIFERVNNIVLLIPYLIGGYSLFLTLNIERFPYLVNDDYGIGITLGYIWKIVPFIVTMGLPILYKEKNRWDKLKKIYSMGNWKFFRYILLPHLVQVLSFSYLIVISYLFTSFEIPYILGISYPKVLSVEIMDIYSKGDLDRYGELMAMNTILAVVSLVVSFILYILVKKGLNYFSGRKK